MSSSSCARRLIALALCLLGGASAAEAQSLKTESGKAGQAIRERIAIGGFRVVDETLTPCVASLPFPFHRERKLGTPWIGRFVVERAAPGTWSLAVTSLDTDRRTWRVPITDADVAAKATLTSDLFPSGNVAITLEIAAPTPGPCPVVVLKQELQVSTPAEQRGQVGNRDDRWPEDDPRLQMFPNSPLIRTWAGAVVRMDVVTPTGSIVPCTGYFITTNVLMTAAHCVSTDAGAALAVVRMGAQRLTGPQVRLVMAQGADGDLDFSLLWIEGVTASATLPLRETTVTPLAVWQAGQDRKLVSIVECAATSFAGHDIIHTCDTVGGSSGSPVQDLATGDVVGLHVDGCSTSNATPSCRNGAKRAGSIRDRITFFATDIKAGDPPAAAQLVAAGLLPADREE